MLPDAPAVRDRVVGVALFSYAGGLFWGLNADWDGMTELHGLVEMLREEFAMILRLAVGGARRPDPSGAGHVAGGETSPTMCRNSTTGIVRRARRR